MAEPGFDLVVVGGGAGGISAARTALRLGRRTALIQDGRVGGDCTFTGCVPSKTLIEAAAQRVPFADAVTRMRKVIEQIADTEDARSLATEGIDVINGRAVFVGPKQLTVDGNVLRAERVVIATGSAPTIPSIPGLADVRFLTNESVFDIETLPGSLAVLGGGAIGCELAQAFARFGTEVHIIEAETRLLPREDLDAATVISDCLTREGIDLHVGAKLEQIDPAAEGISARLSDGSTLRVETLLVAVGRRPVTDGLQPQVGGVELDPSGYVRTDRHLATTAPGVYAVGDVTGQLLFTHAADEMGRIAARNAFGRVRRSTLDTEAVPWVTFTDPEVAQVGVTEAHAPLGARVAMLPMSSVDRAVTAGRIEGFVKLIAAPRPLLRNAGGGKLIGATIVAPRAGEMIHEAALAIRTGMFTGRLAQTVHAYPTWSTALRKAAAQFFFEIDGRRARPATGRQ